MRRRFMRTNTVDLGVLLLCVLAPVSSKAKTDHTKCEDRSRAYYCPDSVRRELYCHYQCHNCAPRRTGAETASHRTIMPHVSAAPPLAKTGSSKMGDFSTFCETTGLSDDQVGRD